MRNYNDSGDVHYDSETDTYYSDVKVDFRAAGQAFHFLFRIPLRIRQVLKEEHWQQAILVGQRTIEARCAVGFYPLLSYQPAKRAMLERLYESFTLEQAKTGNNVWAVPQQMEPVGPKPEHDFD